MTRGSLGSEAVQELAHGIASLSRSATSATALPSDETEWLEAREALEESSPSSSATVSTMAEAGGGSLGIGTVRMGPEELCPVSQELP
jgi:hypothetical protein